MDGSRRIAVKDGASMSHDVWRKPSHEQIADAKQAIADLRNEAVMKLRQTGTIVKMTASDTRLFAVCDEIIVEYDGDSLVFKVDGQDMSQHVQAVKIEIAATGDVMVMPVFRPKALVRINREPTAEEIKRGLVRRT